MPQPIADKIATMPTTAGVYLWRDGRKRVLYVGKASNLRARLRQYLRGDDTRFFIPFMVREANDVDVILTHTPKEALLLENELIKQHRPRYNVLLVDDKNFLHLRVDPRAAWPRFTLVRQISEDGALYFGPFTSASKARDTLATLQRAFPLRTCTDHVLRTRKRACLLYQMHRCAAPCVGLIERDAYDEWVQQAVGMLRGHYEPLLKSLTARMDRHAEALEFEQAARTRDAIASIRATLERQSVVDTSLSDRDVWGVHVDDERMAVAIVPVREGVMGEPKRAVSPRSDELPELLSSLINTAYPQGTYIPPEIVLPIEPSDPDALVEVLSERRGKKVRLVLPLRGDKTRLLAIATDNARLVLDQSAVDIVRRQAALDRLATVLGLADAPRRIECFDNSNLGGSHPVAAMSVFIDGEPARSEYRRYRVKSVVGADDYASMREILHRRLTRGIVEHQLPDLIVIDGGRGQVGAAAAVLTDLGLDDLPIVGLSKPRTEHKRGERGASDKIVLLRLKDPIRLPSNDPALRLLQHVRDEVHDTAVRYHRQVRRKNTLSSVLEAIPGVGPARRKSLLQHLGSAEAVLQASVDQIAATPGVGQALAEQIHRALHPAEAPDITR
jgi:excinuclease ABC subunit C